MPGVLERLRADGDRFSHPVDDVVAIDDSRLLAASVIMTGTPSVKSTMYSGGDPGKKLKKKNSELMSYFETLPIGSLTESVVLI